MMQDNLGDRLKAYEAAESARKFMPLLPIYARLDGRSFSRFTKGMNRPFDADLSAAMIATTKHLVASTHAKIGYTQSDEISLIWHTERADSEIFFDGKIQKMVSVLAAQATGFLMRAIWQCPATERLRRSLAAFRLPSFSTA